MTRSATRSSSRRYVSPIFVRILISRSPIRVTSPNGGRGGTTPEAQVYRRAFANGSRESFRGLNKQGIRLVDVCSICDGGDTADEMDAFDESPERLQCYRDYGEVFVN